LASLSSISTPLPPASDSSGTAESAANACALSAWMDRPPPRLPPPMLPLLSLPLGVNPTRLRIQLMPATFVDHVVVTAPHAQAQNTDERTAATINRLAVRNVRCVQQLRTSPPTMTPRTHHDDVTNSPTRPSRENPQPHEKPPKEKSGNVRAKVDPEEDRQSGDKRNQNDGVRERDCQPRQRRAISPAP
jgi:hypothetical protein